MDRTGRSRSRGSIAPAEQDELVTLPGADVDLPTMDGENARPGGGAAEDTTHDEGVEVQPVFDRGRDYSRVAEDIERGGGMGRDRLKIQGALVDDGRAGIGWG